MLAEWDTLILRGTERIFIVLGGVLAIYLGYRLFHVDKRRQGTLELEGKALTLKLSDVAPGVFFAALGACVLVTSMWQAVQHTVLTPVPGPELAVAQSSYAASSDLPRDLRDKRPEPSDTDATLPRKGLARSSPRSVSPAVRTAPTEDDAAELVDAEAVLRAAADAHAREKRRERRRADGQHGSSVPIRNVKSILQDLRNLIRTRQRLPVGKYLSLDSRADDDLAMETRELHEELEYTLAREERGGASPTDE